MTAYRMSICMVSDDFLPGATGVGSHLQTIVGLLADRGHRVVVLTSRRSGEAAEETWHGARIIRLPTVKMFGFFQAIPSSRSLKQIIEEIKPEVIHQHYLGLMLVRVGEIARRLNIPQVYTYHMTEAHLTQPLLARPFRKLVAKRIVRWCNSVQSVISVSKLLGVELASRGITTRIDYISNPVRFLSTARASSDSNSLEFVVMFAGRLNPEKNIPFLLRSFAILKRSIPRATLWIAGHGSQKGELEALASMLGIIDSVTFFGFLSPEQLAQRYAGCNVFVLPSRVETQGLVAMEAMWFGKPIVVARSVVSATELVEEGVNGFCVDADADEDLAGVLKLLAHDPDLSTQMGDSGRRRAIDYAPDGIVSQLETVYRGLLPPMVAISGWTAASDGRGITGIDQP